MFVSLLSASSTWKPSVGGVTYVARHVGSEVGLVRQHSYLDGQAPASQSGLVGIVEIEERDFYFEISPEDYQDEEANIYNNKKA